MNKILFSKKYLHVILLILLSGMICFESYCQNTPDTLKGLNLYQLQLNRDTVDVRLKQVQDSILARENFVRDSILQRQQILDSLIFMQHSLQPILEAIHWTINDDIVSHTDEITIIGDSVLSDYVYYKLIFNPSEPYTPWKVRLNLNAKGIRFDVDNNTRKIKSIQAPYLNCSLKYAD